MPYCVIKSGFCDLVCSKTYLMENETLNLWGFFFLFLFCSEESYNVTDYSLRDQLVVQQCDSEDLTSSPVKNTSAMLYSRQTSAAHLFRLLVLSNHAGEKVEMLLGTESQ